MYQLTNIQTSQTQNVANVFDCMSILNGANYDHLKCISRPEHIYNMLTNYDRHIYLNLIDLSKKGGIIEHRGSNNIDIRYTNNN